MNLSTYTDLLLQGTLETLYMTVLSTCFAYILGLPLGILMVITQPGHLRPNRFIQSVVGWFINIGRSIPFLILIVALFPLTKVIVGKSIGSTAAIVPLVIGAAPFIARLIESSLSELDMSLIESARAMGCTTWQVIHKVMLPEALPSIVRGLSISMITLIGYSAMAGTVGGGGLGDIAIRYGYHRYDYSVMLLTIIILILLVQSIQLIFNTLANKLDKKKN
ncbi:MAG: methionine ABC transporter permease [Cellulosilyticaceae bacterium]